ncbi:unnamed protein product [Caenorhabditis auriculariae]|uniref:PDZ domain-containing protein n=1 Tax=Caenorhabditis auriculariae TaxID=2777116 RepID=A0A8S1HS78_9PELO|nr:unnamed protein product [Caenorhabditis auriculariae]
MAQAGTIKITIDMEEGEPLGATPNDKLVITKIQNGTIAEGKLRIGDQIKEVNGRKINDTTEFFRALRYAAPAVHLTVLRDEKKAEELEARVNIPEERAKLIQRREGFVYELATLIWQTNGPKLGLGIKHYQNRVQCLVLGDHLCDVDGVPVTDKDVAKDLLVKNIQEKGRVTFVVERPDSVEAKLWSKNALSANVMQPPSVQMNEDVRAIAARERGLLKQRKTPDRGAMAPAGAKRGNVTICDINSHEIGHDNEGKALRRVK